MSVLPIPRLAGREVVLRALAEDDAPLFAAATAESRETYAFNPVPEGLDGAHAYVTHALAQHAAGRRLPFAIEFRGRVVGCTSLYEMETWEWPPGSAMQRHGRPDVVKIGYTWLAQSAQRTGCNTEAKLLLLGHAFEAWEVHCVAFCSDARNLRSRAAIERLGARFDGILRAHKPATDGGIRDSAFHSILRCEWPAARARLQALLAR